LFTVQFPHQKLCLAMNNVVPIATLARTSLAAFPSPEMQLPKHLKSLAQMVLNSTLTFSFNVPYNTPCIGN